MTSREGRPIKIEGNELHPASLGATDAWAQASILSLYDPDRSQTVMHLGEISTWEAFLAELRGKLEPRANSGGEGSLCTERDDHFADACSADAAVQGKVSECPLVPVRADQPRQLRGKERGWRSAAT